MSKGRGKIVKATGQRARSIERRTAAAAQAIPAIPRAAFHFGSTLWPGIAKLTEEGGEVLQVTGKLMATGGLVDHWDGTDLAARLSEELGDLYAALDFVIEHNADHHQLDRDAIERRRAVKLALFNKWHRGED